MPSDQLSIQAIGWISSLILVPSLGYQTYQQWKEGSSEGVSVMLYLGSFLSNVGFAMYSWFQRDWVFIVSNAVLSVNSAIGLWILYMHRVKKTGKSQTLKSVQSNQ
jgi:uncharacterized protein with PQ loop repeat